MTFERTLSLFLSICAPFECFAQLAPDPFAQWPSLAQWRRAILLEDYNTRVVVGGTAMLGMAAGLVGSFTLLRRRALMGDAIAHSTLPGIGLAFIIATSVGWDGKALPILLLGAAVAGLLGVAAIMFVRKATRLKEDTALGIVLSVFFGAGVAVLGVVQQMKAGHAAGLGSFIYGKTASMLASDAILIGGSGLLCLIVCVALFKEFKLLCFDDQFAGSRGFPVAVLDVVLMSLVIIVTIVGLQAVGLVLMIALLVIPAAAARFWTEHMQKLAIWSTILGAVSCIIGAWLSAIFPRLPSGAMIVLASSLFFVLSMIFGTARGLLVRQLRRLRLNGRIDHRHILRGLYELSEQKPDAVFLNDLFEIRSWSFRRMKRSLQRTIREGSVTQTSDGRLQLTHSGKLESARLVHEHRLWEMYLIAHADIAPSRVDRDADAIEHILEPEMISELEALMNQRREIQGVAPNPHASIIEKIPDHLEIVQSRGHS